MLAFTISAKKAFFISSDISRIKKPHTFDIFIGEDEKNRNKNDNLCSTAQVIASIK